MSVAPTDAAPILTADLFLSGLACESCCTCFCHNRLQDGLTMREEEDGVKLIRDERGANCQAPYFQMFTSLH